MKLIDLTGRRFGGVVAMSISENKSGGHIMWRCLCDCGAWKDIRGSHLTSGKINSCGCTRPKRIGDAIRTHGLSKTRTYRIWRNMLNRCHYEKYHEKHYYAGRGIVVCEKWRKSFDCFLRDMGMAPKGMSIDRINNDGNYESSNCRWATSKVQANNKTKGNRYVSPRGLRPIGA